MQLKNRMPGLIGYYLGLAVIVVMWLGLQVMLLGLQVNVFFKSLINKSTK